MDGPLLRLFANRGIVHLGPSFCSSRRVEVSPVDHTTSRCIDPPIGLTGIGSVLPDDSSDQPLGDGHTSQAAVLVDGMLER